MDSANEWSGECLYCRRRAPARGVEHVTPEALGAHGWTLPRGAVCDRCNSGVLSKLDQAVAAHPHIGAVLMLWNVPGKGGRLRERSGMLARIDGAPVIAPPARWIERTEVDHRARTIKVGIATPPEFRTDLFRRGLYKIALNALAAEDGLEAALSPRLDRVRAYVIRPNDRNELLPYVQRTPPPARQIPPVAVSRCTDGHRNAFALWLLAGEFFVDLSAPESIAATVRSTDPEGGEHSFTFHGTDGRVGNWDGTEAQPFDPRRMVRFPS